MTPSEKPRKKIGFQVKESLAHYGRKRKKAREGPEQQFENVTLISAKIRVLI